ncbi:MAG: CBS domain-containing protein, partial [Gammaproteobacteria bacterium]|nr:CBS domain-containing protein [Gammaproteobacteria bacterium]
KNVAQQKEPQPAIIARQIMRSPVTTLTESASLLEAWNLFRETRYRHIPIVNVHGVLTGLVSDRDLLRYAATSGHVPPYDENSAEAKLSIRDLMRTRVLTASPETEIRFIARVLIEQRIGVMPIVNEQSEPLGMITRSDILRTIIHHSELELWV